MQIEVGGTYQSVSFRSITRKVTAIEGGVVTYQIINSRYPDDPMFNYENRAAESEFKRICKGMAGNG